MPKATIVCNTEGAEIRYTTNGTDVLETSPLYEGEIDIEAGGTIKAKGFKIAMNPSNQVELQSFPKLQTPTVSVSRNEETVIISIGNTVSGATYRYKVGSAPSSATDGSPISSSANMDDSGAVTVYVRGWYKGQYNPSDSASASVSAYAPKLKTPTLSLSRNGAAVNGTIGNTVSGATYVYKIGSAPTSDSDGTPISGNTFSFTNNSAVTVYVRGFRDDYEMSDAVSDSVSSYVTPTLEQPSVQITFTTTSKFNITIRNFDTANTYLMNSSNDRTGTLVNNGTISASTTSYENLGGVLDEWSIATITISVSRAGYNSNSVTFAMPVDGINPTRVLPPPKVEQEIITKDDGEYIRYTFPDYSKYMLMGNVYMSTVVLKADYGEGYNEVYSNTEEVLRSYVDGSASFRLYENESAFVLGDATTLTPPLPTPKVSTVAYYYPLLQIIYVVIDNFDDFPSGCTMTYTVKNLGTNEESTYASTGLARVFQPTTGLGAGWAPTEVNQQYQVTVTVSKSGSSSVNGSATATFQEYASGGSLPVLSVYNVTMTYSGSTYNFDAVFLENTDSFLERSDLDGLTYTQKYKASVGGSYTSTTEKFFSRNNNETSIFCIYPSDDGTEEFTFTSGYPSGKAMLKISAMFMDSIKGFTGELHYIDDKNYESNEVSLN